VYFIQINLILYNYCKKTEDATKCVWLFRTNLIDLFSDCLYVNELCIGKLFKNVLMCKSVCIVYESISLPNYTTFVL